MGLEDTVGYCLASQQIREIIASGQLTTQGNLDKRIQPSSFEPVVGDEVFVIDTKDGPGFKPKKNKSVYRTLLELPAGQRPKKHRLENGGFYLSTGFSYLVRLEDKIRLDKLHIKASPKSSMGRLFLHSRLMADFSDSFDAVHPKRTPNDRYLDLWYLVEPLAFNIVLRPGMTLGQLRFISDYNARLNSDQIASECESHGILYTIDEDGVERMADPIIAEGLAIHLDLSGRNTNGIVGLRARKNDEFIDLGKKGEYKAEDFFMPVKAEESDGNPNSLSVHPGRHYLLASDEILKIPKHLNVELQAHSHVGIKGPLHFAGFIDNGFRGDLVFEIKSDEIGGITLHHGMQVSTLDLFMTREPDFLYGDDSLESNYQDQVGCKPSKHFKDFDFKYAARNYRTLDKIILVQDSKVLCAHRKNSEGFEFLQEAEKEPLLGDIEDGFFHSRYDCEEDDLVLQPIPYIIVFGPEQTVFSYVRCEEIEKYGEVRLFNRHSVGLGGHVRKIDGPDFVRNCVKRELHEEVQFESDHSIPELVGTIMAYKEKVDTVHFGLVYVCYTDGDVRPLEASIREGSLREIQDVKIRDVEPKTETWSKYLIPNLEAMYRLNNI